MAKWKALKNFSDLERGDMVRHTTSPESYVVSFNYGSRVTAVTTVDLTNPKEWEVLRFENEDKKEAT